MARAETRRDPDSFRGRLVPRLKERGAAEGLVVFVVFGWWLLSLGMPDFVMPGPDQVAWQIFALFTDPGYLGHVATSTLRVAAAVVLAVLFGGLLAFLPRWLPITEVIVQERILPLLNSFPSVGWAILAMIWFGPSHGTIVFVMVAILTPFCLVNIAAGLKELDRELIEMAHSFTRSRWRVLVRITLPLLMPYIVSALRIAYGVGWKIALVAELFGTESGLGFVLQRAQTVADAATVFATCFAIVLLFWAGEKLLIDPLARRFQVAQRGAS